METNQSFEYIVTTLIKFRKWWIFPAVAGVVLSALFVFIIKSNTYTASQSLIVRDDLLGQAFKPGQFSSLESMKSAQETILEVARKPQVIENVMTQLGPESVMSRLGSFPSEKLIEQIQGQISFSAPNGAEFGKTEVIILNAKGSTRERAGKFVELLLTEMDKKLGDVRTLRLESMEAELIQARDASAMSLEQTRRKSREMDKELGGDVAAMKGLIGSQASDASLRQDLSMIRNERRIAQAQLESALDDQDILIEAQLNPRKMLATSSDFIRSQPTLEALQKALVDSKQVRATAVGKYEPEHPIFKSSDETILAMEQQIFNELENMTESNEAQIRVVRSKLARLDGLADKETERMGDLGSKHLKYLTINQELQNKTTIFQKAQTELSEVQSLRMVSGEVSWLLRMDQPQVSTRPDGMGKKATIMAGGICGLMMGLGIVMLIAPPMPKPELASRPGRRSDIAHRANEGLLESESQSRSLNDVVGPTAAAAIQSASAATTATVNKGVAMARSAMGHSTPADTSQVDQVTGDESTVGIADDSTAESIVGYDPTEKESVSDHAEAGTSSELDTPWEVDAPSSYPSPTSASVASQLLDQVKRNGVPSGSDQGQPDLDSPAEVLANQPLPTQRDASPTVPVDLGKASADQDMVSKQDGNQANETPVMNPAERPKRSIRLKPNRANPKVGATIRKRPVSNVRPVDLAKTAGDDSSTFIPVSSMQSDQTRPIDDFMASDMAEDESADQPNSTQENPFLKNRPGQSAKPKTDQNPTPIAESELPIPDQIKKLSDSIKNFAKPVEPKDQQDNDSF